MLEVQHLSIEFHDKSLPETVVHDLSFSIGEGERVGLVGESGSGKTITALAVAGLLARHAVVKEGSIRFGKVDLLSCSRSALRDIQGQEISMVFQEPMTSLNPVMKVGRQVEESLRIHTRLSPQERKERALAAMRDVELLDPQRLYEEYPHQLSGGMRQRVMIAAAIVCRPKLLIADEPTTALDVSIQDQILVLLDKISREYRTAILFISHDLGLVRRLTERVLVMYEGRLVEQGDTEELFAHPREAYTRKLIASIPTMKGSRLRGRYVGEE